MYFLSCLQGWDVSNDLHLILPFDASSRYVLHEFKIVAHAGMVDANAVAGCQWVPRRRVLVIRDDFLRRRNG